MRHVAYCFALLLAAGSAFGQAGGTGTIQGTVTDPSGAVVAGATVTATNLATGVRTERKTTDAGFFVLSFLPAGEYTRHGNGSRIPDPHATERGSGCAGRGGLGSQVANRSRQPIRHGGSRAVHAEDRRCRARRIDTEQLSTIPCPWR